MALPTKPPAPVIHTEMGVAMLINEPPRQIAVSVDAAVAQERPMRAGDVHFAQVDRHEQNLFLVDAGFGDDLAGSAGDKALAPEFNPSPPTGFSRPMRFGTAT